MKRYKMDKVLITTLQTEFNQLSNTKAKITCKNSSIEVLDYFRDVTKMVKEKYALFSWQIKNKFPKSQLFRPFLRYFFLKKSYMKAYF